MRSPTVRRMFVGVMAAAAIAAGASVGVKGAERGGGLNPSNVRSAQTYMRSSMELADKGDLAAAQRKLKTAENMIKDLAKRHGQDHEGVQTLQKELEEAERYVQSKSEAPEEPAGAEAAEAPQPGAAKPAGGKRATGGRSKEAPNAMYVSEARDKLASARRGADRGLVKHTQGLLEGVERLLNNLAKKHGGHETMQELFRELEETKAYVAPKLEAAQAQQDAKAAKAQRMSQYSGMASSILERLEKVRERAGKHSGRPDDPRALDTYAEAKGVFEEARSDIKRIVAQRTPQEVDMLNKAIQETDGYLWSVLGDAVARKAASVRPPEDVYNGSDKADLEQRVRKQWQLKRPGEDILGVRFDQERWVARKEKVYNSAIDQWQVYDEESLRVAVIAKSKDDLAAIYEVFPRKDHTQGGGVEVGGFHFREEMLASNLK